MGEKSKSSKDKVGKERSLDQQFNISEVTPEDRARVAKHADNRCGPKTAETVKKALGLDEQD